MYTRSLMSYLTQISPTQSLLIAGSLALRSAVAASVVTGCCCDGVPTVDRLRLSLLQPLSPGASGEAWRAWQGWEGLGEEGARMHHEDEHDRLEKQLELRGGRADGRIEPACESKPLLSGGRREREAK
jgi:hypothetical protein